MLYIAPLDGLRLLAFLSVFIHHLPGLKLFQITSIMKSKGWIGVELFFVISSFLFFYLFEAEYIQSNSINKKNFYLRRILRIYPLMVAFALAMTVVFKAFSKYNAFRFLMLVGGVDNLATAADGYSPIPYSAQLWTLSFEFQAYLIMPFLFLAYKRLGLRRFFIFVFAIWLSCTLLRIVTVPFLSTYHPVWVLPLLRPDSILAGFLLAILAAKLKRYTFVAFMSFVVSLMVVVALPPMEQSKFSQIVIFPFASILCAATVLFTLIWSPLIHVLSLRPIAFAGTISFGLYIFHFLAIDLTRQFFVKLGLPLSMETSVINYCLFAGAAFILTLTISTISYFAFEKRFLKWKARFAIVQGRPS